jgi:flavin-binding protein dodecin
LGKQRLVVPAFAGKEHPMSVASITEISASSPKSFMDAVDNGLARASKTLEGIKGAWVEDQEVVLDGGKISEYRVKMKVTFVLKEKH